MNRWPLVAILVASPACSKDAPPPSGTTATVAAPSASAAPGASASGMATEEPILDGGLDGGPPAIPGAAVSASSSAHGAAVPGSFTKLLDAGQPPRRNLRYTWHLDHKEQLAMDLRTSATTEVAGSRQPEIPLPPVHIVLDIDPRSVTPEGNLRFAWRVSAATVTTDPQTPGPINDGMRIEIEAIDHLAGTAMVTDRGLCAEVKVDNAARLDAGATGQMVEQVRQTLRDVAAPLPEEDVGRGARWQKTSQLDAKGSHLTQTDTFTLTDAMVGDTGTIADVLAQTAPSQLLPTPGQTSGAQARMESMLASGESKTHFDLSHLVPQSKFTGTTTMVVSGQGSADATKRVTMVMRVGIDIEGHIR